MRVFCLLASSTAFAQIQISLSKANGDLTPEDFELTATLQSGSRAMISIDGLSFGEYELVVTARDVRGNEGRATQMLTVNRRPRLFVTSEGFRIRVVRPSFRIAAHCEDDDPTGCEVRVQAVIDPWYYPSLDPKEVGLWTGQGQLDQEVCLSDYVGRPLRFNFQAVDSRQHMGPESWVIHVEDSARLSEVTRVPGLLYDFDAQHLLYLDAQRRARLIDRTSGQTLTLMENVWTTCESERYGCEGRVDDQGFLLPGGALILSGGRFFHATKEGVTQLSNVRRSVRLAGPYALYVPASALMLKNLVTGTVQTVATGVENGALAADGTVFFSDGTRSQRYRDGLSEPVTQPKTSAFEVDDRPETDGTRLVFRRSLRRNSDTLPLAHFTQTRAVIEPIH